MTILKKSLNFLISVSVPIIISVLSILILLSPLFMKLEYRRPTFPEDNYGFSTEERLLFGDQTRRYLITGMSLDDLRELKFTDGDQIYTQRELTHLEDVKVVLQGVLRVFAGAAFIYSLGGVFAFRKEWREDFLAATFLGGKITTGLLIIILVLTLISFQSLFTNFHLVFFEGDSWLFYYSDTLIRLFPIRFWQDIFLFFGLATLAGGILVGWALPYWILRSQKLKKIT
jgi:integral membrane protein (TIGR01906 family)